MRKEIIQPDSLLVSGSEGPFCTFLVDQSCILNTIIYTL